MLPLVVLGATGSIGRQTLEVAAHLGLEVAGLAAFHPSRELAEVASSYPDATVAVVGGAQDERASFAGSVANETAFGEEAVTDLSARTNHIVVNGIVGSAGLAATLAGLEAGNRIALANKESMVAAGELVTAALERGTGELIPVDSEHSALHQCLAGEHPDDVSRLLLTASGGPFRGRPRSELLGVGPEDALAHPTWDMGGRITIDSATLMNKGLEVIEAHHLFGVGFDRIDVVVHPQSLLHSAVEFVDGALKAHLGHPDMRVPIQYALTYPRRGPNPGDRFDLTGIDLVFEAVDRRAFPALDLAYSAGRAGGTAPAVLNAADEVAVAAFLRTEISFLQITEIVARTLDEVEPGPASSLPAILAADREARRAAERVIATARSNR